MQATTGDPSAQAGCWIGRVSVGVGGRLQRARVLGLLFTYRVDWCEDADLVLGVHYRHPSGQLGDFMIDRGAFQGLGDPSA
ncbi:hypothetical protein [Amycolatopsis pithecellobii]|uniref:Uncharacterized protein n=1 Tax=Amycolatopsis pithecellobii TaxID=664692 RepID=A0A6N7Z4Y0_9PSEU|nr:hypothetical protein [Amycolatopsis pithecellobii]MTD55460.1 hypothetical protein [Amycolatopsis pithecellobii]